MVYNARGIATDSTVFEAGLPVGLVTGVQRTGPDAILTLRSKAAHDRSRSTRRSNWLEIPRRRKRRAAVARAQQPAGPKRRKPRLSQDQNYTEVDQILNELFRNRRRRRPPVLPGIGTGWTARG